jgi:hypothetical protein
MHRIAARMIAIVLLAGTATVAPAASIVADHTGVDTFGQIPVSSFQGIRDHYRFFYGHTSHGSQIVTGVDMLQAENPILYAGVAMAEYGSDLGHNGDLGWVAPTRDYLDAHPECNAVIWSWCGGCSDNTPEGITAYLQAMQQLEVDYPAVLFVCMTGHLDGSGPAGVLYQSNNQIRTWCAANNKVLFDFADIESWDPADAYYPDESDACGWCSEWCSTVSCPTCGDCAHSHCFNCYRKGQAFWWMMARAMGWQPATDVPALTTPGPRLEPASPNPFLGRTTIRYYLAEPGPAQVSVLDAGGRVVAVLQDGPVAAGDHQVTWSGRDTAGRSMPSGVYLARVHVGGGTQSRKLFLMK